MYTAICYLHMFKPVNCRVDLINHFLGVLFDLGVIGSDLQGV